MLSHCNISRISIHAPAKGATKRGRLRTSAPFISSHAPAKGATDHAYYGCVDEYISIHAPAKGATTICFGLVLFIDISIHAPAKGATGIDLPMVYREIFQSTLPRRERHFVCLFKLNLGFDFNPRSREGSDSIY